MQAAVICRGCLIKAIGPFGFNYKSQRAGTAINISKKSLYRTCQRADPGLQKDMRRLDRQLLIRFQSHCHIALHDPQRYPCIPIPSCILYNDPAVFLCQLTGISYCIVIVHICDFGLRTFGTNIGQTFCRRALRHINYSLLLQSVGCPGNTTPMITVSSCNKCFAPQQTAHLI